MMTVKPSDLLGANLNTEYGKTIIMYDSVNGDTIGKLGGIGNDEGFVTVVEIKPHYTSPDNVLWLRLEDPERVTWVQYVDDFFLIGNEPIIIDQKDIDQFTPSFIGQIVESSSSTITEKVTTILNSCSDKLQNMLPTGAANWFSDLSEIVKRMIIAFIGFILLYVFYLIFLKNKK